MKIRIPKQISIGPYDIKILKQKDLAISDGCLGKANILKCEIFLQEPTPAHHQKPEQLLATYIHELLHIIFCMAKREDLSNNEELVDILSEFMTQIIKTSKGKLIDIDL